MLADKIFQLASFQRQYEALLSLSVCDTILDLNWKEDKATLLSKIDWNNILSIASVLSYSERNEQLDASLRIAQTCLAEESTTELQKNAAAIILENLTNKPAIRIAIERGYIDKDYKERISLPLLLQANKVNIENSIVINDETLLLNKFQKTVYDSQEDNDAISISAPTSAGKSFILYQILLKEILNNTSSVIVYVVPTRALISQVENDLRQLIRRNQLANVSISTVPQSEVASHGANIYIFTQERLHWFLIDNISTNIQLLVIDEAQKIDDGNRGILLQQKIEEVVQMNSSVKVYFSSPFTSNPELLLENIHTHNKKQKVDTEFVAVNQNLIYVNQVPRKVDLWEASLSLINKLIPLGNISLIDRPNSELKKLAFITRAFSGGRSGNLIYSNGSAESEDIALLLYDTIQGKAITDNVQELIKLIKKTIHSKYILAKVLEKGIAFHYGNMPLLIRQEIERLFREGEIDFLICTSTLLEGVNLPAKSIFIRKPTRGRGNPLNQNDFWNLAGRAGRWGKEFSGNIFCIEPHKWDNEPNPNKSKQTIKRAIDEIEKNRSHELIEYIQNNTPRDLANKRQDLEFAFGYYYNKFLSGTFQVSNDFYSSLASLFENLRFRIQVPQYIIKRNPGISPIAQQALLEYFYSKLDTIESLIPVYPEDANAVEEYTRLVGRIGKTISSYPPPLNHSRAILLVNWMRGRPLAYLISSSYKSYQKSEKQKTKKTLRSVIRETMENVENFVRFRFAKDSSCYIDILRYFLELNGKVELIQKIPQLNLWLEFGVSQKTHLSLLSLGLTRNTVIELSSYITNSQMNKEESLQWIRSQELDQLNLSPIILEDVRKIF